ncbi:hypothetical protein ACFVYF_10340 [Streptomyces sp. NPDC058274]|uniref:hypothetical protein n=1 Tax=Streptomyces sp. NPDC058274 TaxID=3346416 RepID=UPI0036EE3AD3
MVRNVLGSVLALIGAAAAVWSPFRAWYDGRLGRYYRLGDLFSGSGVTDVRAALFGSVLLPFVVAAVVTLAGILLRSRSLVALAGVIVLAFTVLWMVRVGQAESGLTVDSNGNGLGVGVATAFGGGVLLLIAAVLMRGRGGGRLGRDRRLRPAEPEPGDRSGPYGPGEQAPYEERPREWESGERPGSDAPTATWRRPPGDQG